MSLLKNLQRFLIESNKYGYASGVTGTKEADHSETLIYSSQDFKTHDNFFGGEPYGGRTVVFYQGRPVWIMVYYGAINAKFTDVDKLYLVLREALKMMPEDKPFRGPDKLTKDNFTYTNFVFGDLKQFSGEEVITHQGQKVYQARYLGGLVDQRGEVDQRNP